MCRGGLKRKVWIQDSRHKRVGRVGGTGGRQGCALDKRVATVFVNLLIFVLVAIFVIGAKFLKQCCVSRGRGSLVRVCRTVDRTIGGKGLKGRTIRGGLITRLRGAGVSIYTVSVSSSKGIMFAGMGRRNFLCGRVLHVFFLGSSSRREVLGRAGSCIMQGVGSPRDNVSCLRV